MAQAHHGRAHGGARARGGHVRARARRAALGAGRGHLQGHATLSNMHEVMCLWLARAVNKACPAKELWLLEGMQANKKQHRVSTPLSCMWLCALHALVLNLWKLVLKLP